MPIKVGSQSFVSISNLKKKSQEKELKKYDTNNDNLLDNKEAAKYYADKTGGKSMSSLDDVYKLAGGKQRDIKTVQNGYPQTWAPDWKGDFHIDGYGAGNTRTNRMLSGLNGKDTYSFVVDCNLMDRSFLENDVASATLVLGRKDFKAEAGSKIAEQVTVPLDTVTQPGYQTWDRGGGSHWVPEKKFLAASVDVKSLRSLAGDSGGLSFYVRLQTNDGKTLWMNKDGQPYQNFQIDASELKAKGNI